MHKWRKLMIRQKDLSNLKNYKIIGKIFNN